MVNAVIFDYGNTLVLDPFDDILRLKARDLQKALKEFDYEVMRKDIIKGWSTANEEVNYPYISHFAQEKPIVNRALEEIGVKESDMTELSKKFFSIYKDGYDKVYRSNPRKQEIKDTLGYLKEKKKKLGIFSNGRLSDVNKAMELYEVHDLFDFIFSSGAIYFEKPDPIVFRTIINNADEIPSKIMYVGDDMVRDIEPAKKAGMKAALFIPPPEYRKAKPWRTYEKVKIKPDVVITKISQLKDIVV